MRFLLAVGAVCALTTGPVRADFVAAVEAISEDIVVSESLASMCGPAAVIRDSELAKRLGELDPQSHFRGRSRGLARVISLKASAPAETVCAAARSAAPAMAQRLEAMQRSITVMDRIGAAFERRSELRASLLRGDVTLADYRRASRAVRDLWALVVALKADDTNTVTNAVLWKSAKAAACLDGDGFDDGIESSQLSMASALCGALGTASR